MDDHPDNEDAGLPTWEAFQRYCDPEIVRAWREAGEAGDGNFRSVLSGGLGGTTPEQRTRRERVKWYKAAAAALMEDGIERLASGELVAFGYFMPRRDLGADPVRIPDDVLQARGCKFDYELSTVSGNGLEFVGVLVYPAREAPGVEKEIEGSTLAEAFRWFVLGDPTLQELAELARQNHPGWVPQSNEALGGYYSLNPCWPINVEKGWSPRGQAERWKYPIFFVGGPEDPPAPDAVVAVYERRQYLVCQLITWFRDGTLAVEGTVEPLTAELRRKVVPAGWWSRDGIDVDFDEGRLIQIGDSGRGKNTVFSDMRVLRSEDVAVESGSMAPIEAVEIDPDKKVKDLVVAGVDALLSTGDEGGWAFARRVHDHMGAPKRPSYESVRGFIKLLKLNPSPGSSRPKG